MAGGIYGDGIGRYLYFASGSADGTEGIGAAVIDENGNLNTVEAYGLVFGIEQQWTPTFRSGLAYGTTRGRNPSPTSTKELGTFHFSNFWTPVENTTFGLEAARAEKKLQNGDSGCSSRPSTTSERIVHVSAPVVDKPKQRRNSRRPSRSGIPAGSLRRAEQYHRTGRLDEAEALYRRILDRQPRQAATLHQLAVLLMQQRHWPEAVELLQEAVAKLLSRRQTGLPDACFDLGNALFDLQRFREAVGAYREALDQRPDDPELHNNLANVLLACGRPAAAITHYRQALALTPKHAEAACRLGICLQRHGHFDDAARWFEQALIQRPDFVEARCALFAGRGHRADAADIERLERLLQQPEQKLEQHCRLRFTLGLILDRREETDPAWTHITAGNRLRARQRPFDPAVHKDYIDRIIACYDPALCGQDRDHGSADTRPVFIVGMPRSGTTLTEQILASHPRFHGAGELDTMRRLVRELPAIAGIETPFPECLPLLTRQDCRQLAQSYLAQLPALPDSIRRVGDKLSGNYVRLGLIALLFPRARVIHCRRDPLDTCLSRYFNDFARSHHYSYRLEHLADVYLDYRRLMAHWQQVLPLPVFQLDYERLIADPRRTMRALLDFCDLPPDEHCQAFHRTEREIATLSFHDVRQPLHSRAVGRWQRYRAHLQPLIHRFEQHGLCRRLNSSS